MKLRKNSIYKLKHLVEGGFLYAIYMGNNQFGLGCANHKSGLERLKRELQKAKGNPLYISSYLTPKVFNQTPECVEVLELVPLKSIKLTPQTNFPFSYNTAVKKDYSKMRILNK